MALQQATPVSTGVPGLDECQCVQVVCSLILNHCPHTQTHTHTPHTLPGMGVKTNQNQATVGKKLVYSDAVHAKLDKHMKEEVQLYAVGKRRFEVRVMCYFCTCGGVCVCLSCVCDRCNVCSSAHMQAHWRLLMEDTQLGAWKTET
jgi:hypothetical protein